MTSEVMIVQEYRIDLRCRMKLKKIVHEAKRTPDRLAILASELTDIKKSG
jgi:hypothetical protein